MLTNRYDRTWGANSYRLSRIFPTSATSEFTIQGYKDTDTARDILDKNQLVAYLAAGGKEDDTYGQMATGL